MPLWMSGMYLSVIPAVTALVIWVLGNEFEVVKTLAVSIGSGSIAFGILFIAVGLAVTPIDGSTEDRGPRKGYLFVPWGVSIPLALLWSWQVHQIPIWPWVESVFLVVGGFVFGIGASFLIDFLLRVTVKVCTGRPFDDRDAWLVLLIGFATFCMSIGARLGVTYMREFGLPPVSILYYVLAGGVVSVLVFVLIVIGVNLWTFFRDWFRRKGRAST